jgi:23S rRNA-/tRNA-specific pseudouridylate synthase
VMVVAKHDAAHRALANQFHDRAVEKEYIALVWGVVQAGRRIDAAIGRDPLHRRKMSARARHARHAVTRITRAHHLQGVTLCQVAIQTGRTHQIRVHLSAIGHPIVGDPLYGGVRRRVPAPLRAIGRSSMPHAWCSIIRRMAAGWSSSLQCRPTSSACSTRSRDGRLTVTSESGDWPADDVRAIRRATGRHIRSAVGV